MPAIYWAEAVSTAVFLLNRSTTRALSNKMPYEAWHEASWRSNSYAPLGAWCM
jgi:hypothetical protein